MPSKIYQGLWKGPQMSQPCGRWINSVEGKHFQLLIDGPWGLVCRIQNESEEVNSVAGQPSSRRLQARRALGLALDLRTNHCASSFSN